MSVPTVSVLLPSSWLWKSGLPAWLLIMEVASLIISAHTGSNNCRCCCRCFPTVWTCSHITGEQGRMQVDRWEIENIVCFKRMCKVKCTKCVIFIIYISCCSSSSIWELGLLRSRWLLPLPDDSILLFIYVVYQASHRTPLPTCTVYHSSTFASWCSSKHIVLDCTRVHVCVRVCECVCVYVCMLKGNSQLQRGDTETLAM